MRNSYEIRGPVTVIFLNDGYETIIDTSDLEKAMTFGGRWYAHWNRRSQSRYVEGGMKVGKRQYKRTSLHRWLMNNPNGIVDHINHDTFDNRRSANLRVVTKSQNGLNRSGAPKSNKTSGIRNVFWNKLMKRWQVSMFVNKKRHVIGYFHDINDAESAAINARKELMGG